MLEATRKHRLLTISTPPSSNKEGSKSSTDSLDWLRESHNIPPGDQTATLSVND